MKTKNLTKAEKKALKTNIRTTKKNLRSLSKSSRHSGIRSTARILKYGTKSFARNIWLSIAATLIMAITLTFLFCTLISTIILSNTADSIRDKIDITVFLKPNTSEETLIELASILKTNENIKAESVTKNTSAEELEIFLAENSDDKDLIETLSDPDMKAIMLETMQSTIRFKVYDTDNISVIKDFISANELFSENIDETKSPTYDVNQREIKTISSWAKIARDGGIIVGLVFLIISILIVSNTVRMAIFSRREEIYMMRLVGAGKGFIRGPFIVEAQLSGLIAGILAATISFFGFKALTPKLASYGINTDFINSVLAPNHTPILYIAMILLGIIIGSFAANIAARHYLNQAK